jgi:hypothetical protein
MALAWSQRLTAERRLLAALFLWPCRVELGPRSFLAPEHGALFDVILDAADFWPPAQLPAEGSSFDDAFLEVVTAFARDYAAQGYTPKRTRNPIAWAAYVRTYITDVLMRQAVTRAALDPLIAEVRQCPRCGR